MDYIEAFSPLAFRGVGNCAESIVPNQKQVFGWGTSRKFEMKDMEESSLQMPQVSPNYAGLAG
jgi:hypothetical protein